MTAAVKSAASIRRRVLWPTMKDELRHYLDAAIERIDARRAFGSSPEEPSAVPVQAEVDAGHPERPEATPGA